MRGTVFFSLIRGAAIAVAVAVVMLARPDSAPAQPWPTNISNDAGDSIIPKVTVTPDGTTHVVWVDRTTREVKYAAKSAGGAWSAPSVVATFTIVDVNFDWQLDPAIGPGADNSVHVLFVDDKTGDRDVYYTAKPPGGSWSAPVNVSNTPGTRSEWPDMRIAANGTIHAVFNDGAATGTVGLHEIFYASKPSGGAWSSPVNISNMPATNEFRARLAMGPDGSLHAVWHTVDVNVWYATSADGTSWSAPTNIGSTPGCWGTPTVAVDPGGTVHVVYNFLAQPSAADVYYVQKPPGGSWSSPVNVSNNAGQTGVADLRADSAGRLHLVWVDNTGGNEDVLYASKPPGGAWSGPTNLSASLGQSGGSSIHVVGNSAVHVVWHDDTLGNRDIFYTSFGGAAVGGIGELPDAAGSSGPPYPALAGGAAAAVVALAAGVWYARRRWPI